MSEAKRELDAKVHRRVYKNLRVMAEIQGEAEEVNKFFDMLEKTDKARKAEKEVKGK